MAAEVTNLSMNQWGISSISYLREYSEGPQAFQQALLGLSGFVCQEFHCCLFPILLPLPFNTHRKLDELLFFRG